MENFNRFDNNDSQLPPGFRFHPTDEELITYYLLKKVLDSSFTARAIAEVDLNKCEPWELPEKAKMGEKEWYFFSLRDRKYPTGLRTNRATEAGYWKATGKDREIYSPRTSSLVGMKKTLVFYRGRAPKGEKSNWVMHEYRLEGKFAYHYISRTSRDEWVISRVFQKSGSSISGIGSGKKTSRSGTISGSICSDIGSPSSSSLPPLLDSSSPYAVIGDCDSQNPREHVPCFSTVAGSINHQFVSPPIFGDPIHCFGRNVPGFPSLKALQENLQLPLLFPGIIPSSSFLPPPSMSFDRNDMEGPESSAKWVGSSELDCFWNH